MNIHAVDFFIKIWYNFYENINQIIFSFTIKADASNHQQGGEQMNEIEFQEKINEISKSIFSYCMAKTSTREDAEDLSQDILLELTKSVANIRDEGAFYGFMWGVAGNVYKQWYKRKLKQNACEISEDVPSEENLNDEDNEEVSFVEEEAAKLSEELNEKIDFDLLLKNANKF